MCEKSFLITLVSDRTLISASAVYIYLVWQCESSLLVIRWVTVFGLSEFEP